MLKSFKNYSLIINLANNIKNIFFYSKIIFDRNKKLGDFLNISIPYDINITKEDLSRDYVLNFKGDNLNFLDVGAKDGKLTYLLGIRKNLEFNQEIYTKNRLIFENKYHYYGMDINPTNEKNVITGDICETDIIQKYPHLENFFHVMYSNNVFEHLKKPWVAAQNLTKLLRPNGIIITIVPFSQRYHEDPGDYFRYTHTGIVSLFEDFGSFELLKSGYDICGRRNNWQGSGLNNDSVPVDNFGAWRETWFTVSVLRKIAD